MMDVFDQELVLSYLILEIADEVVTKIWNDTAVQLEVSENYIYGQVIIGPCDRFQSVWLVMNNDTIDIYDYYSHKALLLHKAFPHSPKEFLLTRIELADPKAIDKMSASIIQTLGIKRSRIMFIKKPLKKILKCLNYEYN